MEYLQCNVDVNNWNNLCGKYQRFTIDGMCIVGYLSISLGANIKYCVWDVVERFGHFNVYKSYARFETRKNYQKLIHTFCIKKNATKKQNEIRVEKFTKYVQPYDLTMLKMGNESTNLLLCLEC